MTWHIFIRRQAEEGIPLDAWLREVACDSSLIVTAEAGDAPSPVVHWIGDAAARDVIHSRARLIWEGGTIYAVTPDDATICKMWDIACALGAHIEDDEGDYYDCNGIVMSPDEVAYAVA